MSQADEHRTTPGDTTPYAGLGVGDAERQAAIAALGDHWRAGRLDPAEHERRTTAAFVATTRGELDTLFADLPGDPATPQGAAVAVPAAAPVGANPSTAPAGGATSWLASNRGAVTSMVPLVALVLFVLTKQWVSFLLIPIAYTLLGTLRGGSPGRDRHRDRRRGR